MQIRTVAVTAGVVVTSVLAAGGIAIGAAGDDPNKDRSADLVSQVDPKKPKNVILLIGDGMGHSEVTLARNYGPGASGSLRMDSLPFRGAVKHYVLKPGPGPTYTPNYVGDSAPTASAWSTGKKTIDSRLSQGPSSAQSVPGTNQGYDTYMELAHRAGKATGNVTTAEITDATPAAPSSHISQRSCQGAGADMNTCPTERKSAGGLGSIVEQQADEGFDLYLGGGRGRYEQAIPAGEGTANGGGGTGLQYAQSKGYSYVSDAAGLDGVKDLGGGKKVLGLFTAGNMTKEFAPLITSIAGTGDPVNGTSCTEGNRPANEPALSAMTTKAIDLLDDDPDGFTLQVEGASIDKQDHLGDVCGQIGETLEFDRAVGVALDFQASHPDTLVVVSADHSHTSLMTYDSQDPEGEFATLKTKEGGKLRVTYGTATSETPLDNRPQHTHSGADVPVMAKGPQGANVQGVIDQTELFPLLVGKDPSTLPKDVVTVPGPSVPGPSVPGPSVPVPARPGKPVLRLAAVRRARRSEFQAGLEVAFVSRDVSRVTVTFTQGKKRLFTRRYSKPAAAEAFRIRIRRGLKLGKATLKLTATGPRGTTTKTQTITVLRSR